MTQPDTRPEPCRVVGGDKLPAEVGGGKAICDAIQSAARSQAPGVAFTVEVVILSPSALAATVRLADRRTLPERRMAVSDRLLNSASIGRFAAAIAAEIARETGR